MIHMPHFLRFAKGGTRLVHLVDLTAEVPGGEVVGESHYHDRNGLYKGLAS
jgi:hypothetical protein